MRYNDVLVGMVRQMRQTTEASFRRLNRQFATAVARSAQYDAPSDASQARILVDALRKRFVAAFARRPRSAAERMQAQVDAASSASLQFVSRVTCRRHIAVDAQHPQPATDMLKASVTENVALIRSIPGAIPRHSGRRDAQISSAATGRLACCARSSASAAWPPARLSASRGIR